MDSVFEAAVAGVLAHEGGYVCDPDDKGGETCFGISKAQYPTLDIKALTVDHAKAIYFSDFWLRYRINQLPGVTLPCKVLDMAVLCGPGTAIKLLQQAINDTGGKCAVDGSIGPQTVAACRSAPQASLMASYKANLVRHFRDIVAEDASQGRFLAGWLNRVAS